MADVRMAFQIQGKALREFERKLKQVLIWNLTGMVEGYLTSLPRETESESDRYFQAKHELEGFVKWVESRVGEPDAPGPAVH